MSMVQQAVAVKQSKCVRSVARDGSGVWRITKTPNYKHAGCPILAKQGWGTDIAPTTLPGIRCSASIESVSHPSPEGEEWGTRNRTPRWRLGLGLSSTDRVAYLTIGALTTPR